MLMALYFIATVLNFSHQALYYGCNIRLYSLKKSLIINSEPVTQTASWFTSCYKVLFRRGCILSILLT